MQASRRECWRTRVCSSRLQVEKPSQPATTGAPKPSGREAPSWPPSETSKSQRSNASVQRRESSSVRWNALLERLFIDRNRLTVVLDNFHEPPAFTYEQAIRSARAGVYGREAEIAGHIFEG